MRHRPTPLILLAVLMICASLGRARAQSDFVVAPTATGPALANPILFVTQVPIQQDFTTIGSVFGNHLADLGRVGRGGDLWIRYPDGTLKNLTAAAGYGSADPTGFQGADAIAVRDPSVHWGGQKAVFSMVVGAPAQQHQSGAYRWQLYEISGLGLGDTPVIAKVPNQPADYNNITPIYGTDDRIIFTSDRPRGGAAHLYPQLDEYELAPTNTGLWSLDPASGDLFQLDHAPSGDFTPILDSFGRVVFSRWEHLQRDQEADIDAADVARGAQPSYGTFNYASEAADAAYAFNDRAEVFPEPRPSRKDLLAGTNLTGHTINFFSPWQVNEDGTDAETLNHIGRHELLGYLEPSLTDDPNLKVFYDSSSRFNQNAINNFLQIKEDPLRPGVYYGVDAPEFSTHASGQVISITAPLDLDADHMAISYVTHRDTASYTSQPGPNHSGLYRDPLPLADGTLVAAHTAQTDKEAPISQPGSIYDFQIKTLARAANGHLAADQPLTPDIVKTLSYWDPSTKITYSGKLWQLQPVEVRARPRPARPGPGLPPPEQAAFAAAGVDPAVFRAYLAQRGLALMVTRNVTARDNADDQQPFNLRVAGGGAQTIGAQGGKVYDVGLMQFFQADQIRGFGMYTSASTPRAGRRVLAQPMHEEGALLLNAGQAGNPLGSVTIAGDGSVAAVLPARRAMTWQMTDGAGTPVVRERIWVTFQPGEVRVCASCHGLNTTDQIGRPTPNNSPQALVRFLEQWKLLVGGEKTYLPMLVR